MLWPRKFLTRLRKAFSAARLASLIMIALFVAVRFYDPLPLEILRNQLFDLYQRTSPRLTQDYPVTIVDIDEKSLAILGQWPWSRSILTQLVDRLREGGAAVIGFDIVFAEPDRLSPNRYAAQLHSEDADLKQRLTAMPDSDDEFAAAIKRAHAVLGRSGRPNAPAGSAAEGGGTRGKASIATIGGDPRAYLIQLPAVLKNLLALEKAAAGLGMLTVQPERDGLIRRAPLLLSAGGAISPGLSIELLRVASSAGSLIVKRDEAGVRSVAVAGVEIPSDGDGQLWIAFGRHDPRRFVPAASVLSGEVPADRINGKIIIIGTSASGLFDLKSTPLDRVIPGVEIHAQIIESILGKATFNRPNFALGVEIVLAVALGTAIVIAAPLIGAVSNLLLGAGIAALLVAGSWYLFVQQKLLIDVSYPLATSFAVFMLMNFMNYIREERRRSRIREAFGQYLSPDIVEQLIREPDRLILGGETRELSILFSDVRGFTTIAEGFKHNPTGLTALMNRMLTSLSHAIIGRRGTIDKYIGDAIMAFWNAPLDDPNHALNACEAGLDIVHRLDALNLQRSEEARETGDEASALEIGVGISTGIAVVGNMGSDFRFDYSVLGDSVNLASRLESLTAAYGLRILVSAETANRSAGKFATLEVDRVRVKGKLEAETIYTLLGGPELAAQDEFASFRDAFHSMLACYRARDWAGALDQLGRCQELNRTPRLDKLLGIYANRVNEAAKAPPAADWDGVFNTQAMA